MDGTAWTASEVRAWLRAHGRGRRASWVDWYYRLFAGLVVGSMIVSFAGGRLPAPVACAPASATCLVTLDLLPLTWLAALAMLVGVVASLVGPLAVSAATASWVLALPLDRGDALSPAFGRLLLAGAVVGLASGVVLWLLTAHSPVWIAACAASGALAILSAVLAQQEGWVSLWREGVLAGAGLVLLGTLLIGHAVTPTVLASATAVVLTLAAGRLFLRARAGLGSMSRFDLARHGQWRSGLAGAASAADAGLLLDIVAPRLAGRPSRPLTRTKQRHGRALAGYEIRRLLFRSPRLMLGWAAVAALAVVAPLPPTTMLAVAGLALIPALGLTLSGLRVVVRAPGLARTLGLSPFIQGAALASGAFIATAIWVAWTAGLLVASGQPPTTAVLLTGASGAAGLAGALRWVTAPPPVFTTGILMTDLGPVPITALRAALTGFDVAIPVAALLVAGASPSACAAVAGAALLWSVASLARLGR